MPLRDVRQWLVRNKPLAHVSVESTVFRGCSCLLRISSWGDALHPRRVRWGPWRKKSRQSSPASQHPLVACLVPRVPGLRNSSSVERTLPGRRLLVSSETPGDMKARSMSTSIADWGPRHSNHSGIAMHLADHHMYFVLCCLRSALNFLCLPYN